MKYAVAIIELLLLVVAPALVASAGVQDGNSMRLLANEITKVIGKIE